MHLTPQVLDKLQMMLLSDLVAFAPELILCFTIVLLLLLRLIRGLNHWHLGPVALFMTVLAIVATVYLWSGAGEGLTTFWFSGLLVYDKFTDFLRLFLLTFTVLIIWLSLL